MAEVLAQLDGPVGRITLNRPDAMNAITLALAEGLERAVRELAAQAHVLVIRGAGGTFCAGGDFHEVERLRAEGPAALAGLFAAFGRACDAIAEVDVPVVCAVEGHATAGGFELVQAADLTLVRSDAKLSDNHASFDMVPGGGGSQRLPRLVGRHRATAHILLGERMSGEQAAALGLAYRAVSEADFEPALEDLLGRLVAKGREAQARTKRLIRDGLELPLADGLALERRVVVEHLTAEVSGEAAAAGIASFTNRSA